MDFTGRRQSDNVDDRRKNWRIYEAFRTVERPGKYVAENDRTRAVDKSPEVSGRTQPMSQDEFDLLVEMDSLANSDGKTVRYHGSVIDNLLRK